MSQNRVEAVDRALSILEIFKTDQSAFHLKEIAERTGYYKSTILRLCGSLEAFGYIRKDNNGLYHLGTKVWQLGNRFQQAQGLETIIRPVLKDMVQLTNESASFYIRDKNRRVCLYRENSKQTIRHNVEEGEILPLAKGAAGKILLAFDHDETRNQSLADIQAQGVYLSLGERDPYSAAIAAPVFNSANQCVGALTVSGLKQRFSTEFVHKTQNLVIKRAKQLSQAFGQIHS